MKLNIDWQEPWDSLCVDGKVFEKELYKEVGKNHILYRKKVVAIGRRYDCDEFLFRVNDSENPFVVVHLTFSVKKESNNLLRTKVFKNLNDWIYNCMMKDHDEFE